MKATLYKPINYSTVWSSYNKENSQWKHVFVGKVSVIVLIAIIYWVFAMCGHISSNLNVLLTPLSNTMITYGRAILLTSLFNRWGNWG